MLNFSKISFHGLETSVLWSLIRFLSKLSTLCPENNQCRNLFTSLHIEHWAIVKLSLIHLKIFKVWCIIDETIFADVLARPYLNSTASTTIEWAVGCLMSMSSSLYRIAFSDTGWVFFYSDRPKWIWKFVIFLKRK